MFGDAVPIRFSKRIHRKSSLSPSKVSSKTKVRRSAVKKRTRGINSSLLKAKEKIKAGKKSKSNKTSNPESIHQEFRKKVVKTSKPKRTTKSSSNVSKILPINEVSSRNHFLESSDKKKNCQKLVCEKASDQQNLRALKLLKSSKEKGRRKELNHFDIKSSKGRKPSQKKSVIQATNSSSKSFLTSNLENLTHVSKHSDRKKSTRLKCSKIKNYVGLSQEPIPIFTVTPVIKKVPFTSRRISESRKSGRLSKESNKLSIPNSKASPCTHSFQSILETPYPEKNSERRKSSQLLEPSPLSTLNKELSFSTSPSLPRTNSNSTVKKSSKSSESSEFLPYKNPSRKRGRPKVSKEEITTISIKKLKPRQRRQFNQSQKISENLEKPFSNKTENLPLDILATPAFKPIRIRTLSKVSNDISTNSHKKLKKKQKRPVNQNKKNSVNLKKTLSNETENLPLDVLATPAFKPVRIRNLSKNYSAKSNPEFSKTPFDTFTTSAFKSARTLSKSYPKSSKANSKVSSSKMHVITEDLQDARKKKSEGFPDIPGKGTLKRKRWLLNNLKEKNECYEDDLYENHNFNINKSFHFGDESDGGSSVNIATPKFDCILTPALPRKTPRFKDCISPSELLQARKTAEEYLYRRNKKRKSGDKPSSSGKKTNMNKKKKVQDIPEKKKLDFEEAVNKLIQVQKNLEIDAEVGDEEDDSYFSDSSN